MRAGLFLEFVDPWINWDWLSTHIPHVLDALTEHVELTVIAIAIGLAISVPLGVLAHRNRVLRLVVLGFFGAFYTIPSLALFALLSPSTRRLSSARCSPSPLASWPTLGSQALSASRSPGPGRHELSRQRLAMVRGSSALAGRRRHPDAHRRASPSVRGIACGRRGDRSAGRHPSRPLRTVWGPRDQHLERRPRAAILRHPGRRLPGLRPR